jgi:phenylpropionate dioxygenase-like ring-hydroxylating dioxygenase large terminal subunit
MNFLKDAWYCAGFTSDLPAGQTRAITMLGEPVVLFRANGGAVAALQDRCPHRFAPLSQGPLIDNQLQCPYHGLRFDATGQCSHNPHADGAIPKAAQVRAYPVLERHGALWVWMGEAHAADPALLPDFTEVDERPGWSRVQGYLHVKANYQLICDNLLDLSHVQFLHPFLFNRDVPPPPNFQVVHRLEQQDASVIAINELKSTPNTGLYQMLWERGAPPVYVDMRANMRWHPPALLLLDTGAAPVDGPREDGPSAPSAHWLTPETATSTHYFWAAARDRYVGDAQVSAQMAAGISAAFANEDEPMIEACQRNMGAADLMALKPVLLPTDGAALRARRVLAAKIEATQR